MVKPIGVRRPKFSRKDAYESEDNSEDELGSILKQSTRRVEREDDDDLSSMSFGKLNKAQRRLEQEESSSDDGSESEGFFEEDSEQETETRRKPAKNKKKSKHAPTEQSAKRPVSKVRQIPGLESTKNTSLYTDIRFDTAFGKSDLEKTRKNYAFLDEYRLKEINEMQNLLKANEKKKLLSEKEVEEVKYQLQSLKSRMDTLKNRDLENKVLKDFKQKHKGNGDFFLKRSDKRKLIQKAKFDGMKSKQREKVMERKRKKRLGKEFKQMEFMG